MPFALMLKPTERSVCSNNNNNNYIKKSDHFSPYQNERFCIGVVCSITPLFSLREDCCMIAAQIQCTTFCAVPSMPGSSSMTKQQLFYTHFLALSFSLLFTPCLCFLWFERAFLSSCTCNNSCEFSLSRLLCSKLHPPQLQLVSYLVQPSGGAR